MDNKQKDKQAISKEIEEIDIVNFIEEFLGIKLFYYQEQILKHLQKHSPNAQTILCSLRGHSSNLLILQLITKALYDYYKGEIAYDKN